MRKESKTIKIYKRAGLKLSIAYNIRKHIKKTKNKFMSIKYFEIFIMLCFSLKTPSNFKMYKILRKYDINISNSKSLNFVITYYEQILQWLNSKEFKEQYIMTNHPYPPLLNPKRLNAEKDNQERIQKEGELKEYGAKNKEAESKEIESIQPYPNLSYESIPPELAWDLNLPLPPYYKFLFWGGHGSGSSGLTTFLEYCGMIQCPWKGVYGGNGKESYLWYFNNLTQNHSKGYYLTIREFVKPATKFFALIPHSKALLLVRDPISNLKSFVQIRIPKEGWDNRADKPVMIALHSNPDEICENLIGYWSMDSQGLICIGNFPSCETISYFGNPNKYAGAFHDTQLKNALVNLKDSVIIDMSEIVGEKAFDTMIKLSKELGFPAPKEKDRASLATQRAIEYLNFLPITLQVEISKRKIHIIIQDNAFKTNSLNITSLLFNQPCFYERIIVCINKNDWEILKQDSKTLQEVKDYLLKFIKRLQQQKEIEDKKKITESQILDYLREHKDLRMQFKQVLDEHLTYIKSVRPDIVESWKYFKEFEKMCEEE